MSSVPWSKPIFDLANGYHLLDNLGPQPSTDYPDCLGQSWAFHLTAEEVQKVNCMSTGCAYRKLRRVSTAASHFLIEAAGHLSSGFRLCQATLRYENLCHLTRAGEDEIK